MNPDVLRLLLPLLLNNDIVGGRFRAALPAGATIVLPIEPVAQRLGPATATFCPAGCEARIVVRDVGIANVSELRFAVTLSVSAASYVGGRRAPFPVTTTLGDLAVDVDTARGSSDLRFGFLVELGAAAPPRGFFRVRIAEAPEALRALGVSIDIGPVTALRGFELEDVDVDVRGGLLASSINAFKADLMTRLRAELVWAVNNALCTRFGSACPPRPAFALPSLPRSTPLFLSLGLTAIIVVAALRKPRRRP